MACEKKGPFFIRDQSKGGEGADGQSVNQQTFTNARFGAGTVLGT